MSKALIRCAIYTRKSSEEGLEQSFNSLEAQREACCAYILSQKHEGWRMLNNHYDDGGFSGGTMERPALQSLLNDIQAGRVDAVVVYKVDRLTRSLTDFARIIEIFDSGKVSFVSVTQNFNTTTSMGRLTLNVLLSFAQFEREITGERIRDKIAASKKKGMWMGGVVPMGYDCVNHRLIVNEAEARTVEEIFRHYLRLGSVRELKMHLDHEGIVSKARTNRTGETSGGRPFSRGALYCLLKNSTYVGEIRHRNEVYGGQHEAIVPRESWDKAAALLAENNQAHRTKGTRSSQSLLTGKAFDPNGGRFTPTHSLKQGKRYRYYTSQAVIHQNGSRPRITRFPAVQLESLVTNQILLLLRDPAKWTLSFEDGPGREQAATQANQLVKTWPRLEASKRNEFIRSVVQRVVIGQESAWIEVDHAELLTHLLGEDAAALNVHEGTIRLAASFKGIRRRGELRIVTPDDEESNDEMCVPSLMTAVARANDWRERIVAGETTSLQQIAQESNLTPKYVRRLLRCASLSPKVTEAILSGRQRIDLKLSDLLRGVPLDWAAQVHYLRRSA